MRVDIWSDVVCPFCYIGKKRLENVAKDAGIELEIHWHSFELDPNAPEKHNTSNTERLAKKYGRSFEEMQEMERNVAKLAATEGIDFQWQKANSGNTLNAHRIIHLAQSKGLGNEAKEAFFHAYMTEGELIGERVVVEKIAQRIGLDAQEITAVLDSDQLIDDVRQDEELAKQMQITGVPFFVFDQKLAISGAQSREVFLQAIQQLLAQNQEQDQSKLSNAASCDGDQCEIPSQS